MNATKVDSITVIIGLVFIAGCGLLSVLAQRQDALAQVRTADAHGFVSDNERSKGDTITTSWHSKLLGVDTLETTGNARLPGETTMGLLERHEEFTRGAMTFQAGARK